MSLIFLDEKELLPSSSTESEEEEERDEVLNKKNEKSEEKAEISSVVDEINDLSVTESEIKENLNKSVGAITSTPDRLKSSPSNIFSPVSGLYFFLNQNFFKLE